MEWRRETQNWILKTLIMKKVFKIFFEKIPVEQLNQERTLTWKMLLPKSRENGGLKFLKIILLVFFTFLILVPLSIIVAIIVRIR